MSATTKKAPAKKSNTKANKGKSVKEHFPQNISDELFAAWTANRRKEDVNKLQPLLGVTPITIYRALTYGHVNQQKIIDGINKYFQTRNEKEKSAAKKLMGGSKNES